MNSKKILIIRFNAIGDIVHTTVIPYAIKNKYPQHIIHYLTSYTNAPILENCPYIDKILKYNGSVLNTSKQLYKEHYDVIIGLNYTLKLYILSFLSFSKKVVLRSYKGKSWVENYFNTALKAFKDLELPSRLYLENGDLSIASDIKNKLDEYPKPHIFLNPSRHQGNPRQGRTWNIKKWKELSKKLLDTYGGTIFINGNQGEKEYHSELKDNNVIILSGLFNIKQTCALLSMADLLISTDSGPIHIASAYNVKTLAILGSTSPDKIKPYGINGYYIEPNIKCKYCWKKKCKYITDSKQYTPCMESIKVKDVMKKISEYNLLKNNDINDKKEIQYDKRHQFN